MKIKKSKSQKLSGAMKEKNLLLVGVIVMIQGKITVDTDFVLSVDYSRNLQEMINAGRYDRFNHDITAKNFPISPEVTGKQEVFAKLFNFNQLLSGEEVIFKLDKAGYRPAILPELLALGEMRPDLQRKFSIVALGSIWYYAVENGNTPYLCVDCSRREINLSWFDDLWDADCYFLAVLK